MKKPHRPVPIPHPTPRNKLFTPPANTNKCYTVIEIRDMKRYSQIVQTTASKYYFASENYSSTIRITASAIRAALKTSGKKTLGDELNFLRRTPHGARLFSYSSFSRWNRPGGVWNLPRNIPYWWSRSTEVLCVFDCLIHCLPNQANPDRYIYIIVYEETVLKFRFVTQMEWN